MRGQHVSIANGGPVVCSLCTKEVEAGARVRVISAKDLTKDQAITEDDLLFAHEVGKCPTKED